MFKAWLLEVWKQSGFWTLIGVVLGFLLGEGARIIRNHYRIRRLKTALDHELRSILAQIPQKIDVVTQMRDSAAQRRVLSGLTVPILDTIYRQYGAELSPHVSANGRNCLHVIYERLLIADNVLATFEQDLISAKAAGIIQDPFQAYHDRLGELLESYNVVEQLIRSYLSRKPTDVFYVENGDEA